MLELETSIVCDPGLNPFLLKLAPLDEREVFQREEHFPSWIEQQPSGDVDCVINGNELFVSCPDDDDILGDVILVSPRSQKAQRLIRRNSQHNTILFTERCDQMCAMCSQPPKSRDYMSWLEHFTQASILADQGVRIGISGGEPTLHIEELFYLLETLSEARSDLSIHILTNAQHFDPKQKTRLEQIHQTLNVLWGVPLYAPQPSLHDEIVGKVGAFEPLMNNLYFLASTGAHIELRTVLTARNVMELPALAKFISLNLPFIDYWAIMAMEPIGYAKANKEELFFDHSLFPEPLTATLDYAKSSNVPVALYNFPICTVPAKYRSFCSQSISDWKRKYIEECSECPEAGVCTGFFEWYTPEWKWEGVHSLAGEAR